MPSNESTPAKTWLARFVDGYVWLILALSAAAMAIITIVMTVQVVFRYGLNASLIWAEEICRYLLIAMTFLPIGLAYQRGEVVSVDFFLNMPATAHRHSCPDSGAAWRDRVPPGDQLLRLSLRDVQRQFRDAGHRFHPHLDHGTSGERRDDHVLGLSASSRPVVSFLPCISRSHWPRTIRLAIAGKDAP